MQPLCWTSIDDVEICLGNLTPKMVWHLRFLEHASCYVKNTFVFSQQCHYPAITWCSIPFFSQN